MIFSRRATILIAFAVSIVVIAAVFVASRPPIAPTSVREQSASPDAESEAVGVSAFRRPVHRAQRHANH